MSSGWWEEKKIKKNEKEILAAASPLWPLVRQHIIQSGGAAQA